MNKNKTTIIVHCGQDIEAIRNQYQSKDCRLVLLISGKENMKDNIIKIAKARLNT